MDINFLKRICCICWENKNNLSSLGNMLDDKLTIYQRLVTTVKEMEFEEMSGKYMICEKCLTDLDIVYNFRIKCLIAKTTITDYMIKLRENNIFNEDVLNSLDKKSDTKCNSKGPNTLAEEYIKNTDIFNNPVIINEHYSYENVESDTCNINISDLSRKIINCKNGLDIYPINVVEENKTKANTKQKFKIVNVEKILDNTQETDNNIEENEEASDLNMLDVSLTEFEETSDSNKQLKCDECELTFTQYTDLIIHMHQHSSEKPYECPVCSKKFTKEHHFQNHLQTHPENIIFSCDQCSEEFPSEKQLKQHSKTHKEDTVTSFVCDICGKILTRASHLKDHKLSHFKDKIFPCDVCGKVFHYKRGLRKHLPIHSGVKPHKCDLCSKTFNRKDNLRSHMKVHNNKKL